MSDWVPEFERKPIAGKSGGTYTGGPWRLVLHTTEGSSTIEQQVARYAQTGNYPHVTADPARRRVAQHVSLANSVTTAQNDPGGVETNRLHAVQVEIIGHASEARHWTDQVLNWLGTNVVGPLHRHRPFLLVSTTRQWVDQQDGFIARPDAPQRMSNGEWLAFNGVCGHQHVPENDHWDPGALNVRRVLAAAQEGDGDLTPAQAKTLDEVEVVVRRTEDLAKATRTEQAMFEQRAKDQLDTIQAQIAAIAAKMG